MKTVYEDTMTMRDARAKYFRVNGFGEQGGYDDAWVNFKLGPIPMPFPNTAGRVRAIKFHDFHHILADFDTDLAGEAEIGAWEIGAGCKDFYAAWALNLSALATGALIRCPLRTFRAFVRGRREQTMYGQEYESLLNLTVKEARERFAPLVGKPAPKATIADAALFALSVVTGFIVGMTALAFFVPLVPVGLATNLVRQNAKSAA